MLLRFVRNMVNTLLFIRKMSLKLRESSQTSLLVSNELIGNCYKVHIVRFFPVYVHGHEVVRAILGTWLYRK